MIRYDCTRFLSNPSKTLRWPGAEGNRAFQRMLDPWKPHYWCATPRAQARIQHLLLASCRQQGRRFLTVFGREVQEWGDDVGKVVVQRYLSRGETRARGSARNFDEDQVDALWLRLHPGAALPPPPDAEQPRWEEGLDQLVFAMNGEDWYDNEGFAAADQLDDPDTAADQLDDDDLAATDELDDPGFATNGEDWRDIIEGQEDQNDQVSSVPLSEQRPHKATGGSRPSTSVSLTLSLTPFFPRL